MALEIVRSGRAREATVWLAWRPGDVEPHWTEIETSSQPQAMIATGH